MKITFLDASTVDAGDINLDCIREHGDLIIHSTTSNNETLKRVIDSEIIITNKVIIDKPIIEASKKLKLIVVSATGYNNIDVDAAKANNVTVCNVVDYSTPIVAQHTISLILNLCGQTYKYLNEKSLWPASPIFTRLDHRVTEVSGKNLGIVGVGNIGSKVGEIAESMGMKIQVLARKDSKSLIHQEWPRLEYASFFENSDIITLHCPLTDSNKHLINNESLSIMKKTSYLINTSRGDLVDESALAIALNEKNIAGAAVDVLSEEPPPSDHCLINESIPNLLVSPHIAWISVESRKRLINGVSSNIKAFLNKSPINQVS
jgi:glycerate dehydrogenase